MAVASRSLWLHGWLVRGLRKGSERACTTSAASVGSLSVAAIATSAASFVATTVAVTTAAAADTTAAAATGTGAATVCRSPEAAGASSSSFIHGGARRRGFLRCALTSCARMHAAGQEQRSRRRERGCGRGGKGSRFDL